MNEMVGTAQDVAADLDWLLRAPALLDASGPTPGLPLAEPDLLYRAWYRDRRSAALAAAVQHYDTLYAASAPLARVGAAASTAAPAALRLGRYAERLLAAAFGPILDAHLLAAAWPLRAGGRTLGECDFLLETPDGGRHHWELAVKFYLWQPPTPPNQAVPIGSLARFVGVGLGDRLDRKLAHLRGHQLTLSSVPEFIAAWGDGWHAKALLKGRLFYPAGYPVPSSPGLSPNHPRAVWLTREAWRAARDPATLVVQRASMPTSGGRSPAIGFCLPSRREWLAPVTRDVDQWLDRATLDVAVDRAIGAGRPILVGWTAGRTIAPAASRNAAPDPAARWAEGGRALLVPDDWPERAAGAVNG